MGFPLFSDKCISSCSPISFKNRSELELIRLWVVSQTRLLRLVLLGNDGSFFSPPLILKRRGSARHKRALSSTGKLPHPFLVILDLRFRH